ncbi:hypothetical protein [Glycomyces xiaoerkulensis]|uniref:hypothetical protein n=1 Tax=Glycomyces xiaoerkulensis TaxID=2038139 RepID=UPI0012FFE35C|nr:hypothetical protein [Glycomyces xiaoerkulensis]
MNLEQLITALLTFAGTVLVTAVGFWQWRRSQLREERSEYRASRINALREVWEALADAEADHRKNLRRSDREAAQDLRRHLIEANLLILRRSPFLLPEELEMAQQFTQLLTEVNILFRAEPRQSEDSILWETSRKVSAGETMAAQAASDLESLREKLADRYGAVVGGDIQ